MIISCHRFVLTVFTVDSHKNHKAIFHHFTKFFQKKISKKRQAIKTEYLRIFEDPKRIFFWLL